MLLTVKEFGLPLGEPNISAVSAISARIILLADVIMSRRKR
jgi:hypothetical protein